MKRTNLFASVLGPPADAPANTQAEPTRPIRHSVAPSVGKLAQALEAESRSRIWSNVDPTHVDPSPYSDRLPDDSSAEFEELKASIAADGQQVPVHLRPHPTARGRYQVAYGHRRWRAALDLNMSLKAFISEMTDAQLVVAQGVENSARQDLTWIERALFAARMKAQGLQPKEIKAALHVPDSRMAEMRSVTSALPEEIILLIGRAPGVGRERWVSFAKLIESTPSAADRVKETLPAGKVESDRATLPAGKVESSDARFQMALDLLATPSPPRPAPSKESWALGDGKPFGSLKTTPSGLTLTLDFKRQPELGPRALELLAQLKDDLAKTVSQSTRKG